MKTNLFVIMSRRFITRFFVNINLPNNEKTISLLFLMHYLHQKIGCNFKSNAWRKQKMFSPIVGLWLASVSKIFVIHNILFISRTLLKKKILWSKSCLACKRSFFFECIFSNSPYILRLPLNDKGKSFSFLSLLLVAY